MKAIYVEQVGGPENLIYGDRPKPEVKPGEALVKIAVSGVNYIDIYPDRAVQSDLPFIVGMEGAGDGRSGGAMAFEHLKPGDRVAYAMCSRILRRVR